MNSLVNGGLDLADVILLDEKYRCIKKIGEGGFGSVWLADELGHSYEANRPVAVKVLVANPEDRTNLSTIKGAFEKEIKGLGRLATESVVMTYHSFEIVDLLIGSDMKVIRQEPFTGKSSKDKNDPAGQTRYSAFILVMELADGGTLGDQDYRQEVVGEDPDSNAVLAHFVEICTGLASAHRFGIFHCDVKPSNFLWFKSSNRVKIADFGISQFGDEFIQLDGGGGSLPYMPAEAFVPGAQASAARDVYSLGCSFFEILTGEQALNPSAQVSSSMTTPKAAEKPSPLGVLEYEDCHRTATRPEAYVWTAGKVSNRLSGLLVEMMSVAPEDRPSLDYVQNELESIRKSRTRVPVRPEEIKLPEKPEYLSLHNISPGFRRSFLKQDLYFIFLSLNEYGGLTYRTLFAVLQSHFPDAFSIFEVFGVYDFVIRVWGRASQFSKLYQDLKSSFGSRMRSLRAQICRNLTFFGADLNQSTWDCSSDDLHAMTRIRDIQRFGDGHSRHDNALRWLTERGFVCRQIPAPMKEDGIKSFCLLSLPERLATDGEIVSAYNALKEQLQSMKLSAYGETRLSLYRFGDIPSVSRELNDSSIDIEASEIAVVFSQERYSSVIGLPEAIVLQNPGVMPKTLLATNRLYRVSDRIPIS